MNLYRYCFNTPIMYVDPFGLCQEGDCQVRLCGDAKITGSTLTLYDLNGDKAGSSAMGFGPNAARDVTLDILLTLLQQQIGITGLGQIVWGTTFGIRFATQTTLSRGVMTIDLDASYEKRECVSETQIITICVNGADMGTVEYETWEWGDWGQPSTTSLSITAADQNFLANNAGGVPVGEDVELGKELNAIKRQAIANLKNPAWLAKALKDATGCEVV